MESGVRIITATDLSVSTSTRTEKVGTLGATSDGRLFRYVQNGASQVTAGQLVVAAALTANSTGLVIPAQAAGNLAAGSLTLNVTNGATAVTQDQFAEGFVEVLGTGGNYAVRIRGNTAAGNAGTITLFLEEALPAAVVAGTNTVNLTASPYVGVVASTTASMPVGVARVTLAANAYGWVQTYGHTLMLATGAIVKGAGIAQDATTTAGNVVTAATAAYQIAVAKEAASGGVVAARLVIE